MLIINSDNYGENAETNQAVAAAFQLGLISSATLAANAPAFDAACALATRDGFADRIGIQLNLSSGMPLTTDIRRHPVFCDLLGRFRYRRHQRILLTRTDVRLLYEEFSAQIQRCRQHGLHLTHAGSRDQIHTELTIGMVALWALRSHQVPHVRSADTVHRSAWHKKLYKRSMNVLFGVSGLRGAPYSCDLSTVRHLDQACLAPRGMVEMTVRPVWSNTGGLIDGIYKQDLAAAVRALPSSSQLTSYRDLLRR
ncbi:ChbG/HpnK family deacetylase [Duganella sp. CT11-25]|jgi:predicted glycoside hydrolase/deacetylase ChbG (UPF0249 family)|uniref:ChbG/HpnK family deacetylase n=1 Tax=unclassified Duganella TaxID=2636909 RepID=UPI0039B0E83F